MSLSEPRLLVTGATGQLGRLVVERLLQRVPAHRMAAAVRKPEAVAPWQAAGIDVRAADYARPETLTGALQGIDRLLLISSNELGQRFVQHRNVVEAAVAAGVSRIVYTSVLHADTSTLGLAEEHRQTEALIRDSGLAYTLLRNGWYTENYAGSAPTAVEHGAFLGSAGEGRIASASRADYADAAVAALLADDVSPERVYELAGDASYSLTEFAAEIARQTGKPVIYKDLPEGAYRDLLLGFGLPAPMATLVSDADRAAAGGALDDDGKALSRLIGRPTTPYAETIAATLRA